MRTRDTINCATQLCAIIGNPVSHSLSPAIHNAAFQERELDFVYVAFEVEDVKSVLNGMRAMPNFRGLSVTIPHKVEVMNHVDEIADVDRHIGSINTVINENGKLIGLGTDGPGACKAIVDAGVDLDNKNVLMLGAGGAARAIGFSLADRFKLAELALLDINQDMLDELAVDLSSGTNAAINHKQLNEDSLAVCMKQADLIIQCTPVGMHPNEDASLVPPELFQSGQVVFDIVYTPLETKLVKEAKAKGLQIISGVEMFINQAVLQFERFTGADAPEEVMRRVVLENLQKP